MYTNKAFGTSEIIFTDRESQEARENLAKTEEFRNLPTAKNLTLIAHRGMGPSSLLGPKFEATDAIPENTIKAFKQAIVSGADGIELDIFKSKDGHMMVIHDDELWRNVYGFPRDGSLLPKDETKESYKVGKKTLNELKQLPVGPSGEKIPTLTEVFDLAKEANKIRFGMKLSPLILNVELKDATATNECLDLITDYMKKNTDSGVGFNSICFCSFNHECLKGLKAEANKRGINNIQIAPGIKTATLFGKENVNPDFTIKEGAVYDEKGLAELQALVEGNNFTAYDAVLWDIAQPLVDLAKSGNKQLHASTSDFRQYDVDTSFAMHLHRMSQEVPVYFKCDEIGRARDLLTNISISKERVNQDRIARRQILNQGIETDKKPSTEANVNIIPVPHLPKPMAYSTLTKERENIKDEFHNQLTGAKRTTTAEKSALHQRQNKVNQQLGPQPQAVLKNSSMLFSFSSHQAKQPKLSSDLPYVLPSQEQVKLMAQEDLEDHRKKIQNKIDGVGKVELKGLERNKHYAALGYIDSQLKSISSANKGPFAPKL